MEGIRTGFWREAARCDRHGGIRAAGSGGQEHSRGEEDSPEILLVRAGQAGVASALEQLVARHQRALYVLCRGVLVSAEDAEDAVQETFLRAFRALDTFQGGAAFRTWLYRIALNVCLQWKASRPPTEPWEEDARSIPSDSPSPETLALRRLRISEALRSLLPRHRALLLLRELEGWSIPEIAAALGWNEKRVRNELYRARLALADWRRQDAEEGGE